MANNRVSGAVFGGLLRTALTNERLFLMGITSLALSLASGWTTFEGMTNFTRSPVLCFLITFGVQGIMLVSAWMIGESFAPGPSKKKISSNPLSPNDQQSHFEESAFIKRFGSFIKVSLICLVFLFAMAISVFFSFDSLFSSIFSNDERQRAGEIRAQNQVGGVLANLKDRIEQRKYEAVDTLFASQGWKSYNARLDNLGKVARSAPELVKEQLLSKMRKEQAEIAGHQESLAQAKGQKAALRSRQSQIEANVNRLKSDRPGLLAEVNQLRQSLTEKQRQLDTKQAEAAKEARGIGATGKEGEGPKFRAIKEQQRILLAQRDVLKTQKNLASTRLEALDRKIAGRVQELALVNGDVAKIEGEASVAKQFIDAQEKRQSENIEADLSATASIDSLDDARDRFRQQPSRVSFLAIQQSCTNLHNALSEVPKIAPDIRTVSCEPGAAAATVAGRIFTLEDAQANLAKNCVIGKGRRSTRIDPLLKLGQRCIQKSGLPEKDANEFRTILSRVDLNRDDKAKNFVVTLNAFSDGNWLAYLALGLAVAIDSLVFLSGLIGARTASYENTGSPADIMKYGLGMSVDIYGFEPEDIRTSKTFFRSISGPSPIEGFLAVIDRGNLTTEEMSHVNKVLTIAGDKILQDRGNPQIFHVEEKFYQNLARQVYIWDKFNKPKAVKPKFISSKDKKGRDSTGADQPFVTKFGKPSQGGTITKGEKGPKVFSFGPKKIAAPETSNDNREGEDTSSASVPLSSSIGQNEEGNTNPPQKGTARTVFNYLSSKIGQPANTARDEDPDPEDQA